MPVSECWRKRRSPRPLASASTASMISRRGKASRWLLSVTEAEDLLRLAVDVNPRHKGYKVIELAAGGRLGSGGVAALAVRTKVGELLKSRSKARRS